MAKNPKPNPAAMQIAEPVMNPIIREILEGELSKAQETLRHGPGGQGWRYNETKRDEIEARIAALKEALR